MTDAQPTSRYSASDQMQKRKELSVRLRHKVLVLLGNTGSYMTAVAWLQGAITQLGGLKPFALEHQVRDAVWLCIVSLFVTWLVWNSINWIVAKQLAVAQIADGTQSAVRLWGNQMLSVALGSLASSAAYIMLYLWAATFVALSDTSTMLRMWASVGVVTVGIVAILAMADKGMGPFAGIHEGRSERHKQTMHGIFVFNVGFMLAVLWELAMELTFHGLFPFITNERLARLIFCVFLVAVCYCLLFVVPVAFRRAYGHAVANSGRLRIDSETVAPLLQAYRSADEEFAVGHVVSLLGHVASQVLAWVMGLGISFNVRGGVSTFTDPDLNHDWSVWQWSAYAAATSLFFIGVTAFLEQRLAERAGAMLDEVNVSSPQVEAHLSQTVSEVDFQNGLLWYHENVLMPMLQLVGSKLRPGQADPEWNGYGSGPPASEPQSVEQRLSKAKLYEKQSATFTIVAAYMAGFAWNNFTAMVLTGKPAYLAPVVTHYWWYAVSATGVAVAASMGVGFGHACLNRKHGLLYRSS